MAARRIKNNSRKKSRKKRLGPLASLLAAGLSFPAIAAAQSVPYPTYVTGPQPNGSWVVGNGQSSAQPASRSISASGCARRPLR